MPSENSGNGLTTFSLQSPESASLGGVESITPERDAPRGIRPGVARTSDVDPETAARRLLQQALTSDAVPTLTAPRVDGTTSTFTTINTETVPLTGTNVVKFRQTLHGIPVYGSLVTVELDESNALVGLDSALGEPSAVDPVASVSPADAVAAAESAPGGYRPKLGGVVPRLNYYFDAAANTWRLVYILEDVPVTVDRSPEAAAGTRGRLDPPRFVDYVVDGHDRTVVDILPRTPSLNDEEQQMGTDAFGVHRTFLAAHEDGLLVLWDQVHNVRTYDFGFGDPAVDGQQLPGEPVVNPPAWAPDAVSAHVNAVAVSEFLRGVLRRDNIDNRGSAMVSTINCVVQDSTPGDNEWHNAFWDGTQMVYGQALHGSQLRTLAANVDVVAHEMFHGVTDHTARLEYRFQSGALNESYSDIFGTIVANFGKDDPRGWDWLLGENLLADDQPFRDLADPTRFDQPAHMDDFVTLPDTIEGDSGGVHVNSGIHNKAAFNLLTAEDDHGGLILTPDEVAAIFYLALTQRLSRTSRFVDSLRAVRASARSLLRNQPADVQEPKMAAIEAAFAAVGITEANPLPPNPLP